MATKAQLQTQFNDLKTELEEAKKNGWHNFYVLQCVFGCILKHSKEQNIDLDIAVVPEGETETPEQSARVHITFIDDVVKRMVESEKALAILQRKHARLQKDYDDLLPRGE